MIVAGLSCIRILEAVKKSLQTFPSASVPLGDVGANFGFEQVSVSKMSEALTGPSNIFFSLAKTVGQRRTCFPVAFCWGWGQYLWDRLRCVHGS